MGDVLLKIAPYLNRQTLFKVRHKRMIWLTKALKNHFNNFHGNAHLLNSVKNSFDIQREHLDF